MLLAPVTWHAHASTRQQVWRACLAVLLFATAMMACAQERSTGEPARLALLIANASYANAKDRLSGPIRDAVALQAALQARGYAGLPGDPGPSLVTNATRVQMLEKLADFKDALSRAGPQAVGLIYFAGHGGADAAKRDNYMLAVETPDVATFSTEDHGIGVRNLMDQTLGQIDADKRPTIVVVVDACRTPSRAGDAGSRGGATTRSMVMPDNQVPKGMLIALSTGPGQAATDAGIYAQVLVNKLKTSAGLPVPAFFDEVKQEVARQTAQAQIPVQQSQVLDKVCLGPCGSTAPVDAMAALRVAMDLRATGDVGQVTALEQLARDTKSVAGLDMSGLFLNGAVLNGLRAADSSLVMGEMQETQLVDARLERSRMLNVNATKARFDKAVLDESIGAYSRFTGASFVNASLQRVSWEMTDLRNARFQGANLRGADLAFADLRGADFSNADLRGAFFVGADLRGARFDGAKFGDTDMALALRDSVLDAQVLSGEICGTQVGVGAWNYARVFGGARVGSSKFFERTIALPNFADGQLAACQIRVGRYWDRKYKFSPVFRAPNSGREYFSFETNFGYEPAFLDIGNRKDRARARYQEIYNELQARMAEFERQRPEKPRALRQERLLQLLSTRNAVPLGPVWLSDDVVLLMLMKRLSFKAGAELPELRDQALMRMHHEWEMERLGAAAPMHDAWAPYFPPNAYSEDRSPQVLTAFSQWQERRAAGLEQVWLPLRCGSNDPGPMTLAHCNAGGGTRFLQAESTHQAAQAYAQVHRERMIRISDVRPYANVLLFEKPLTAYPVAQQTQPYDSGSQVRHEVELRVSRFEVQERMVIWHVTPGRITRRPWAEVWPVGYSSSSLFE